MVVLAVVLVLDLVSDLVLVMVLVLSQSSCPHRSESSVVLLGPLLFWVIR